MEELRRAFPNDDDLVREVWKELERVEESHPTIDELEPALERSDFPRELGRFSIQRLLGRGGQGEVYEARDRHLDRLIALKILSRRLDLLDSKFSDRIRARFRREAESAARLDHPGVCAVYDSGVEDGVPWIAMQLVRGHSLLELLNRRRRSDSAQGLSTLYGPVSALDPALETTEGRTGDPGAPVSNTTESQTARDSAGRPSVPSRAEIEESILVIEQVALALQASHRAGLIHRDIKPGNIMITESRRPVILDFGLASDERSSGPTITVTGDFLGSPAYMAPEQARGRPDQIDRRTDVYGLGVTLFECLTLKRPFEAPSREALLREIETAEPPSLRALNPLVSRDLETIVHCALEKSPDRRYDSAEAFAEDLRRLRSHESILARSSGPLVRLSRWRKRNPVLSSLLAALLVFALVGGVWSTLKQRELRGLNADLGDLNSDLENLNRELGASNEKLESTNDELADSNHRLRKTIGDYERLADVRRLENAQREAAVLWPVSPELIPKIEAWQERYASLATRLPEHLAARDELRQRGEFLEASGAWDFGEDDDAAFRHEIIQRLVQELTVFADPGPGLLGDVARRLAMSRRIEAETVGKHLEAWRNAAERVAADTRFPNFELKPVVGLIPLGSDPESGLEEFLFWRTHAHGASSGLPERNGKGRFEPKDSDGVILVLIPGGEFLMGSQFDSPEEPNYRPASEDRNDAPTHRVRLSPYFLAKYEFTQAQWKRVTNTTPSKWRMGTKHPLKDGSLPGTLPLEWVSWKNAKTIAAQWGLQLPTEAQWERAARAGSSTIWPGTSDKERLSFSANLCGLECAPHFDQHATDYRDAYIITSEIGRLSPNAFGLHDMIGNVSEWTLDVAQPYTNPVRKGDGLRDGNYSEPLRIARGGSFRFRPLESTCATRFPSNEITERPFVGFRAALGYPHD